MSERFEIKEINPSEMTSVQEVDEALYRVDTALATINTQLDFELQAGLKSVSDLDEDRRNWFFKARSAKRYAETTLRALKNRREVLWDAVDAVRNELINLKGEDYVQEIETGIRERIQS